ncbi:MAG: preprotein translocase subunit SecY, partial [Pseudomonadota bacterium]
MAKPGQGSNAGGLGELWTRIWFVIGAVFVFRLGSYVPIPGIDGNVLSQVFDQQTGTIVGMF